MSDVESRPWPRNPKYLAGADGTIVGPRGHVLKVAQTPKGYTFVGAPSGRKKQEYVHVIVCETFHGSRPEGKEVAHENGIRRDCRAENLSWKTPLENQADRRRHGTDTRGEDHAPAKLTEYDVREIRRRAAEGESGSALGRAYGVSQGQISRIVRRQSWSHLPPSPDEDMTNAPKAPTGRRGEANATAKLTEQDVRDIRAALTAGELQRVIGARYGLGQTTVGKIARRERWAHVA